MPDTRFSWRSLLEHLRKFGVIYLIGIAVCLFGTNLLWTMTAPTVPPEQSVIIYLAAGYSNPEPLNGIADEMLKETQKIDSTLKKVEFQSLQYIESEMDYSGPMTLLARLSVGEGDAFLASRQVMDQLVLGGALLPLDEIVENGWLRRFELEPYNVTVKNEETGEEMRKLVEETFPNIQGGVQVFPNAPQGLNTGEGRLQFPTTSTTIVPVGPEDPDLEFRFPADPVRWDDLAVRWRKGPWRRFAQGGGLFPVEAAKGAKVRFHRIANSLVADVEAPAGVEEVRFGGIAEPDGAKLVPMPYYSYGSNGGGL